MPTDRLEKGDIIVIHTGEVVPVDGHVVDGMALIDQHALTGESTPAEKGTGDRVFASTLLVAGEIRVSVETSGSETASARIGQILRDTAGYKMTSQHKGERLADKAVIPTLGVGALGMATMGPIGAVAVLNSDLGTGIRMAAPLAMLSSLSLCASKGILVKDGRALEQMNQVDTVLFDKTGTLTREQPEVGRIIAAARLGPRSGSSASPRPPSGSSTTRSPWRSSTRPTSWGSARLPTDDTQYKVGYGISVRILGHAVRVGSKRFMESEGIELAAEVSQALDEAHREGHTMVLVAVDGQIAGAIELRAAVRPEVRRVIADLRQAGIRHIAIVSGDHEAPTRRLAESLGMDRYFAQVLPADKADYVAKAPGRRPQGLLRRRRHQRLDRTQEGRRLDLAPGRIDARDRHRPGRLPRRRAIPALRAQGNRARPRPQREPELVDDRGAQRRQHDRRLHDGLRDHDLGRHQQCLRPGGAGQRPAAAPQSETSAAQYAKLRDDSARG